MIAQSLPEGVEIVTVYDRSNLIVSAIETLRTTLLEERSVVALVTFVFLLHVRSALVAIIMLPVGLRMAFRAMRALGIGANIMSLGGIAIAIGAMIDAVIVMVDNAHKHLERAEPGKPRVEVLIEAAPEDGRDRRPTDARPCETDPAPARADDLHDAAAGMGPAQYHRVDRPHPGGVASERHGHTPGVEGEGEGEAVAGGGRAE